MTIDIVNKWLATIQSVAIIGGVVVAVWQLVGVNGQNRIQSNVLKHAQQTASASLVFQIRDRLDSDRYIAITDAVQDHDHNYSLLWQKDTGKEGKFRDEEIERYMSVFEDMGYLVQEELINGQMAFDHFSYDVGKAWCNADVQRIIRDARKADRSVTAASDPIYGRFENLAQTYLAKEGQSCKDLDIQ